MPQRTTLEGARKGRTGALEEAGRSERRVDLCDIGIGLDGDAVRCTHDKSTVVEAMKYVITTPGNERDAAEEKNQRGEQSADGWSRRQMLAEG